MAKEDLPRDTARWKEKRKTATIMEEPSDGLHENQNTWKEIWQNIDISGVWEWMDGRLVAAFKIIRSFDMVNPLLSDQKFPVSNPSIP